MIFLLFLILWLTGLCVIICINLMLIHDTWVRIHWRLNSLSVTHISRVYRPTICLLKQCYFFICRSISFKETDVGKVSGYPKKDLKNLKHKFYLKFPTGSTASNSSVTQFVVVNSALYGITGSVVAVVSFWV